MSTQGGDVDADGFAGASIDFSDDDPKVFRSLGGIRNEETIPAFERQTILPLRAEVISSGQIIKFVDNGVDLFRIFL